VLADRPLQTIRAVIVGVGPAAAGLARACVAIGVEATLIAPTNEAPKHTLCAFADTVEPRFVAATFARALVATDEGVADIGRPYVRLDNAALMQAPAAQRVHGRVRALDDGAVVLDEGRHVLAAHDAVVDASGHAPVLVQRAARAPAWQSAYGVFVRGYDRELPPGTALFMDWRDHGVEDGGPPSFLYALAERDGSLLLEETTLASWAPVAPDMLRARLMRRLQRRGTVVHDVLGEEQVCFPMGGGLPIRGQRVAAFGAALGVTSPISGYSVAASLARADAVARAIASGPSAGAGDAVLDAVWTRDALSVRSLQRFGLAAAASFSRAAASSFFSRFFTLPPADWRSYLDGDVTAPAARATMLALFRDAPMSLRARLMRGAASVDAFAVVRDALANLVMPQNAQGATP